MITCNHDWQPYSMVVDTYEELQDVEVWGVQCIGCGEKYEGQHAIGGTHTLTCTKPTWIDDIVDADGNVIVKGHYTDEGGSRPYTETRQEVVTIEVTKNGWKCSICGAEQ